MAAACLLVAERGGDFIVEQPVSSLMFEYLPWKALRYRLRPWIRSTSLHLGAYGAPTPKLTKLMGMCEWLPRLKRPMAAQDKDRIEADGIRTAVCHGTKRKVSGSKHLKATQTYPVEFGAAVACQFSEALASVTAAASATSSTAAASAASSSAAAAGASATDGQVALATRTKRAQAELPSYEWPLFDVTMQSLADGEGDGELWAECKPWWLEDILRDDDAYWDARLKQEHSLELED